VSYKHQNATIYQKSLRTPERNFPQYTLETANRFETLTNLPADIITYNSEIKSVKESSEYTSLQQWKSFQKENVNSRRRQVCRKDSANKIPTLVYGLTSTEVSIKKMCHNLKSNIQSNIEHQIIILSDSHARGLSSHMKNNLDENYSVCVALSDQG